MGVTATIELPFPLGVPLWTVVPKHISKWVTCPECLGTKEVLLTLANGESYRLDCRACQSGFDPPIGRIQQLEYDYRPRNFVACSWSIERDKFFFLPAPESELGSSKIDQDDIFITEEDALRRAREIGDRLKKQQDEQFMAALKGSRRGLAWSVHYWRNQLAESRQKTAWIEDRLRLCAGRKEKRHES